MNECLTGGNEKQNEQVTSSGKQHVSDKNAVENGQETNKKTYGKFLINLVCSARTEKDLPSALSHGLHSFVTRSLRKHQANTFLYGVSSRLIKI